MAGRYIRPSYQYFDNSGRVLDSGQLFFYDSGTTTLKNVYSDPDGLTAIANPVVLDGAGRTPNVYLDGSYKLIIKDKNDVQIEERDPVLAADDTTKGFSSWNAVTTYSVDDIVRGSNNLLYISITSSNQNNDPTSSAVNWTEVQFLSSYNVNETYSIGDVIINSVGDIYKSLTNSNTGNTPGASPSNWTSVVAGTFATVDIDGGTIDGTVIGGATPAAGSFTTLSASGTLAAGQTTLSGYLRVSGNSPAPPSGSGDIGAGSTTGLQLLGYGSTYDTHLANRNGAIALAVDANTQNISVLGNATFAGTSQVGWGNGDQYIEGSDSGAKLEFYTSDVERMQLSSIGMQVSGDATVSGDVTVTDGTFTHTETGNVTARRLNATHGTFTTRIEETYATRAATSGYIFALWASAAGGDVEAYIRGDGNAYADGSWNGGGADYAEYFEWADGNPNDKDRVGYSVALVGNQIKIAEEGDTLIGVISAMPAVVGDNDMDRWKGKHLKDDFGRYIFEPYSQVEWTEVIVEGVKAVTGVEYQAAVEAVEAVEAVPYQPATEALYNADGDLVAEAKPEVLAVEGVTGVEASEEVSAVEAVEGVKEETKAHSYQHDQIPAGVTVPDDVIVTSEDEEGNPLERRKLNPEWVDAPYVSREDRPEWSTVGLMGKLRIRKGQPVASNWIKMRDVSDEVEEWLIR